MKLVDKASKYVTKAICMDITSLDAFDNLPINDFDIAVVGIGESIAVSVLCCLALQEAGINYIIAKAGDRLHKRVLEKLEINEIVLPEEDSGVQTAQNIMNNK